jgi:hypothetical protein
MTLGADLQAVDNPPARSVLRLREARSRASRECGWSTGQMELFGAQTDPATPATRTDPDEVLVVDGANVVGSRPDGWWKDRPGAAARLHDRLVTTSGLASQVVLVLEGRARGGVAAGLTGSVEVVHADGEGDDTIVAEVARAAGASREVAVVTADRGLTARVEDLGATVRRPGWLLERIEADGSSQRIG